MKRVLFSLTATLAGLLGLLSFRSHGTALATPGALSGTVLGQGSGVGSTHRHHQRSSGQTSTRQKHGSGGGRSGGGRSGGSGSGPSVGPAAASTVLGNAIQTPYGVVQVKVTVAGSRIERVSYVKLTAYDGTSQQINGYAAPILVRQTLQAQSAHINGVSGASYTSAGYDQSLQSALDKVGIH